MERYRALENGIPLLTSRKDQVVGCAISYILQEEDSKGVANIGRLRSPVVEKRSRATVERQVSTLFHARNAEDGKRAQGHLR